MSEIICVLDIGTSKVAALVGEVSGDDMQIIALESRPSKGLQNGVVVNINDTVEAIAGAVQAARFSSGAEVIDRVTVGLSSEHVVSKERRGTVHIRGETVSEDDIDRVVECALAGPKQSDMRLLHVIPVRYSVDEQENIKRPVGMVGGRLDVDVQTIMCPENVARNIENCVNRCDLEVDAIVLEQLASAKSVLCREERELGVCLLDIGCGTTDVLVYINDSPNFATTVPIAGRLVTRDIATALTTTEEQAERLKLQNGCALASMVDGRESITVEAFGGRAPRRASLETLTQVIQQRYEELFMDIRELLQHEKQRFFEGRRTVLGGGVVLTGGASNVRGLPELCEEVFGLPARVGCPGAFNGPERTAAPCHATGVGLMEYAASEFHNPLDRSPLAKPGNWLRRVGLWPFGQGALSRRAA